MLKRKRNQSTKNEKIEKIINVIKKSNEFEKIKAEERKKKKSNVKPKGYQARKFGVYAFWFIFVSVTLLFFITLLGNSNSNNQQEVKVIYNKAVSFEAVEFGRDFLYKYYTWTNIEEIKDEIAKHREELLSRYVTKKILETVVKTSENWNSSIEMHKITLMKSEDVGDNRGYLTYKVVPTFTKSQKGLQSEKIKEKEQTVKKVQYVTLKVYYDQETKRFVIYDLPVFVNIEEGSNTVKVNEETRGLSTTNDTKGEIKEFLETFFDTYTNDSIEKLSYLFENQNTVKGLDQSLTFEKIKSFDLYKGRNSEEKVVVAEVLLRDPQTDMEFLSNYTLVIVHSQQGYLVRSFNDKQYIDKIIKNEADDTIENKQKNEND